MLTNSTKSVIIIYWGGEGLGVWGGGGGIDLIINQRKRVTK